MHKYNADLRSSILKGVFEQNRRIAGQGAGNLRVRRGGGVGKKRHRWALFVTLATVLVLLPDLGLGPSLSPDGELTRAGRHSTATASSIGKVSPSPPDAGRNPLPAFAYWTGLLSAKPLPDPAELDKYNYLDYSLLLSGNDDVRLISLFGLDVKTIVIDPGHGGVDPGAVGALGTKEKDVTLDIALRLRNRLKRMGNYKILLTREKDKAVSLAGRVQFANADKADLFISVHVNSLPNELVNVIETYYFGPPLNDETLRIAKQENKDSHYAIGDFKAIIQDISNTVKRQESVRLASSIQNCLFNNVKHYDADVLNIGVKMAPFVVLLGVEAPSVLVEISCITNEEEEKKLASADYREKVASFLEEGIVRYLTRRHLQQVRGDDEHERKYGG